MAIFGVVVEDNEIPKTFFKEVKERISQGDLARSPFNGGVVSFISLRRVGDSNVVDRGYTIKMSPIYFNFTWLGAGFCLLSYFLFTRLWLLIPVAIFLLLGLVWSSGFYYFMLKLGLKKKGYNGYIKYLRPSQIIEEVYFNGNK